MRIVTLTDARKPMRASTLATAVLLTVATVGCGGGESVPISPVAPDAKSIGTIKVRAIPLDGWTIRDGFVVARQSGGGVDSVSLDANGLATLRAATGSSLDLRVDVAAPRLYHASAAGLVVAGDTTLEVVMIPTTWVVQRGRYAAARRPIDIVKAFGSDNDDTHFLNAFTPSKKILVAWPEESLPIPVGFDSTGTTRRWEAADSAWFWSATNDVNEAMGRQIFRPTGSVALTTRNVIGIHVDYDNRGYFGAVGANPDLCKLPARVCTDLHGAVSLSKGIFYHSIFDEGNFRSMQHEMMHALGFGHGCYWPSIMMHTGAPCASTVPTDVSVDDVAYMELIFRLASVLAAHPQAWNLDEALAGAR